MEIRGKNAFKKLEKNRLKKIQKDKWEGKN
jgi:hypothetical protein